MSKLRLTEIFYSLQGETNTVGIPTVFVRLTGCPLRCQYCDTTYAFQGGNWYTLDAILAEIKKYRTRYVTITGGEPLAQKACLNLLTTLCDLNYVVSLETSGALSVSAVDSRVIKIIDIKTPGSKESEKNKWENLLELSLHDQLKFVICNELDYAWCKEIINQYQLAEKCQILFSPSFLELEANKLADWILQDQLPVRMQIQLHKFLWGNVQGR